jgi:hypothetical protein
MERRNFLKAVLGLGAATVAASTLLSTTAEALPIVVPPTSDAKAAPTADFNPDRDGAPKAENAQYYYRRRRRRRFIRRRRRIYRRRRLYRRRRRVIWF